MFLEKPFILDVKFETKNKNEKRSALEELSTARSFEVISEYDSIARTRKGVDAGTFIGFDLVTKNISRRPLSFDDHYGNMKHGNKTPNFSATKNKDGLLNSAMFDSRIVLDTFSTTRALSNYVREHDPESVVYNSRTEDYAFQRKAIFENLKMTGCVAGMSGPVDPGTLNAVIQLKNKLANPKFFSEYHFIEENGQKT